jgi:hypothetical protein
MCWTLYKHEFEENTRTTQREKIQNYNYGSSNMEVSEVENEGHSSGATRRESRDFDERKFQSRISSHKYFVDEQYNNIFIVLLH